MKKTLYVLLRVTLTPQFTDENGHKRFLKYYYGEETIITRIREQFHEKEQLQKLRTSMINQLRQRLAFEYPEAVKTTMTISPVRGFTPIIGWLAQRHEAARQENKYKQSVAHQLSIQISDYTRSHTQAIYDLEIRLTENQDKMLEVLKLEQFQPYFKVFDKFGFGVDNKLLLLYHIYPFEKFLHEGKPLIEHELNDKDKLQKRDRSLRKFQAFLGMSAVLTHQAPQGVRLSRRLCVTDSLGIPINVSFTGQVLLDLISMLGRSVWLPQRIRGLNQRLVNN